LLLTYKNIFGITALILLAFFSFLMLRIIFIYIPVKNDAGFLQLKQEYIHITEWRIAFFTHVFTSMLVLIAGFTQFSKNFLKQQPKLHRTVGYIYVINILMVTGPSGLLMSFYANGGISSQTAFVLLSVLWMGFTAMALYKAIKKDFKAHRIFMIRSFALTLSAITLRCWKVLLVNFTDIQPMDRYRIIAWLGWTLNLIIAEWIIYKYFSRKKQLFTAA
jgi:Na+/phosphate symporter